MIGFTLAQHDIDRLKAVDARLALVVGRAAMLCPFTFTVAQGLRTEAQQRALVAAGKSETMHSMHLIGRAVDLVVVTEHGADWHWGVYVELNALMQQAGRDVGHGVFWGGQWHSIKDGDHWQLSSAEAEKFEPCPDSLSSTSFMPWVLEHVRSTMSGSAPRTTSASA